MGALAAGEFRSPYPANLTMREVQLLQALADGESLRNAAQRIGRSYNGTKNMMRRIYDKTGMDTQAATIAWCFRHKVIC